VGRYEKFLTEVDRKVTSIGLWRRDKNHKSKNRKREEPPESFRRDLWKPFLNFD
jgi:hypothetical protein